MSRCTNAAAHLSGQVPSEAKKERMRRLLDIGDELSRGFHAAHLGTTRPVLWESARTSECQHPLWRGYTDNYIPVYANARNLLHRVTPVQLERVYDDGVWGSIPGEAV